MISDVKNITSSTLNQIIIASHHLAERAERNWWKMEESSSQLGRLWRVKRGKIHIVRGANETRGKEDFVRGGGGRARGGRGGGGGRRGDGFEMAEEREEEKEEINMQTDSHLSYRRRLLISESIDPSKCSTVENIRLIQKSFSRQSVRCRHF